jgi:hypothetical protein
MDNLKVSVAAIVGVATPATNWLIVSAEPVLRLVLLVGQIGVAVATIVYIYHKIVKAKSK